VSAFVTHAVLPGETLGRIEDSRLLDALVVTDSHPRASDLAGAFLQVVPVAPVVGAWLLRTAGVEGVPDRVDVGVVP
jgi:phosphoribosylpyrophosphate synthetase